MMKKKINLLYAVLVIAAVFTSYNTSAQFTYGGVSIGYNNIRFDKGTSDYVDGLFELNNNTSINGIHANINLFNKPLRFFGVGMQLGVPLINRFKWSYNNAPTNGSYSSDYYELSSGEFGGSGSFAPSEYEYDISKKFSFTLQSRFFIEANDNFFVGVRYSFLSFDESFIFERRSSGVPNQSISYAKNHTARGFGFESGIMPHIGDHFFINCNVVVDFLKIDNTKPFRYEVEFDQDFGSAKYDIVVYHTKIEDSHIAYQFNFGFGYFF